MRVIRLVFWNGRQRRLRSGWRLVLQVVLLGLLAIAGGLLLSALLTTILVAADASVIAVVGTGAFTAVSVLSVWLAGRFLDRRSFADFGFHRRGGWWLDFAFGLALGALLLSGIFFAELAFGWLVVEGTFQTTSPERPFALAILPPLLLFVLVGIQEEIWVRGYQLHNLAEGLNFAASGPRAAVLLAWVLSSILFGLYHLGNPNTTIISTANLVLAGLFLGLGYILTGELALPIGLHIAWNFFEGHVFGFPVSGTTLDQTTFIAIAQQGPDLWTGGAFGPEAGLIGNAALVVGALLILAWVRLRHGRIEIAADLAAYRTGNKE